MSISILTVINKLYDEWNIQGFILLSLSLQTILILFAPFRKRTGNAMIIFLIWVAYLVADWAANFAVGLISNSQKNVHQKVVRKPDDHVDILAFWAPFLLLHLGGPDTITAFALEDNALWLRHLVGLISQVVAAIIVFGQSFPRNKLWLPTVFLFVAGTVKYVERTRALFLANLNRFRASMLKEPCPSPKYAKLMEEYSSMNEANLPTQIEIVPEPIQESETGVYAADGENYKELADVGDAYNSLFKIFDGLLVDLIFSFRESNYSRRFFRQTKPRDAFKVLAIELNFIYEVLYTKVLVVHSRLGHIVRFISWCAVVAALSTFYSLDKHCFRKIDIGITYTLLFGAIGLDTISLLMKIFSDWTAVSCIQNLQSDNRWKCLIYTCFCRLLNYYLTLKSINWPSPKQTSYLERARQILFRRWSESLHQYNLIDYCLKEVPKNNHSHFNYFSRTMNCVIEELGLKDIYDWMKYVSQKPLTKELWEFIFDQVKKKSIPADDPNTAKWICSARGAWALQKNDWISENRKLMHYIVDVEYDQSLILWHIATELCYHGIIPTSQESHHEDTNHRREFCKIISDYMLYLLVMQPTMMSAVAGIGQKRFCDTCTEAKNFLKRKVNLGQELEQVCTIILAVPTDLEPVVVNGDRSKSVLFDACILAKELGELQWRNTWGLMSEVWVELLCYAASHCRANTHAAQLSKGGELITFVWLLMAHFGIGDQYHISKGSVARAKLIVGK